MVKLGIESYVAVPLIRRDGSIFGTLCALDPQPADLGLDDLETFRLLADLLAYELEADDERQQLEAAELDRRLFIEGVAHDLKTPLQVIKSQAQMLQRSMRRRRPLSNEVLEHRLHEIEASVNRSKDLIDEVLDALRLRAGQRLELSLEPTDLGAVTRAAVAALREAHPHREITLDKGAGSVMGMWDASRVARVLDNLLSNAVRYSPSGGQVTVCVARVEDAAGVWAVVRVRDAGIGIPAADLPVVFERFRRGRNVTGRIRGSGIGLAGARQIVEQHGGTISGESVEGEGSTFTVRLPIE